MYLNNIKKFDVKEGEIEKEKKLKEVLDEGRVLVYRKIRNKKN